MAGAAFKKRGPRDWVTKIVSAAHRYVRTRPKFAFSSSPPSIVHRRVLAMQAPEARAEYFRLAGNGYCLERVRTTSAGFAAQRLVSDQED